MSLQEVKHDIHTELILDIHCLYETAQLHIALQLSSPLETCHVQLRTLQIISP
jgi:hypothetical protein